MFDSGVGGLTIVRALRLRLPHTPVLYVGDVAHAPYGNRTAAAIVTRSLSIAEWLAAEGAGLTVVACNTATVTAIEALRAHWPAHVFVGVEPGIKPAAARSAARRIAVMATPATAASARLRHLIDRYASALHVHVHVEPCAGLAGAIESGVLDGPDLEAILAPHCAAIRAAQVDTVVLGCTHYAFIEASLRRLLGDGITLVDTASAIAERAAGVWEENPPVFDPAAASHRVLCTGKTDTMQRLVARCAGIDAVRVESLVL